MITKKEVYEFCLELSSFLNKKIEQLDLSIMTNKNYLFNHATQFKDLAFMKLINNATFCVIDEIEISTYHPCIILATFINTVIPVCFDYHDKTIKEKIFDIILKYLGDDFKQYCDNITAPLIPYGTSIPVDVMIKGYLATIVEKIEKEQSQMQLRIN